MSLELNCARLLPSEQGAKHYLGHQPPNKQPHKAQHDSMHQTHTLPASSTATRRGWQLWCVAAKKPHVYAAAATVVTMLLVMSMTSTAWIRSVPVTLLQQHTGSDKPVPVPSRRTPGGPSETTPTSGKGVPAGSVVWSGSLGMQVECGDDGVAKPFSVHLDTADEATCKGLDKTHAFIDKVPPHAHSPPISSANSGIFVAVLSNPTLLWCIHCLPPTNSVPRLETAARALPVLPRPTLSSSTGSLICVSARETAPCSRTGIASLIASRRRHARCSNVHRPTSSCTGRLSWRMATLIGSV